MNFLAQEIYTKYGIKNSFRHIFTIWWLVAFSWMVFALRLLALSEIEIPLEVRELG
jgi:hypothetical protein